MKTCPPTRRNLLPPLGRLAVPALLPATGVAHGDQHPGAPRELVREQMAWGIAATPAEARRTVTIRMRGTIHVTPKP